MKRTAGRTLFTEKSNYGRRKTPRGGKFIRTTTIFTPRFADILIAALMTLKYTDPAGVGGLSGTVFRSRRNLICLKWIKGRVSPATKRPVLLKPRRIFW